MFPHCEAEGGQRGRAEALPRALTLAEEGQTLKGQAPPVGQRTATRPCLPQAVSRSEPSKGRSWHGPRATRPTVFCDGHRMLRNLSQGCNTAQANLDFRLVGKTEPRTTLSTCSQITAVADGDIRPLPRAAGKQMPSWQHARAFNIQNVTLSASSV